MGRVRGRDRLALFTAKAEAVAATVERIATAEALPSAVASYLRTHNLPSAIICSGEDWLDALPWDREPMLARQRGASSGDERVSLTSALAG